VRYPPLGVALPASPCGSVNPVGAVRRQHVADQGHEEGSGISARGEAAWKEERERIAARNEQARKAGKQRRETYEREREEARRRAERRRSEAARAAAPGPIRRGE
jgi:hypothetical protein